MGRFTADFKKEGNNIINSNNKLVKILKKKRHLFTSLAFLTPALLFTAIFFYIPLIEAFRMSFYDWALLGESEFIGFTNFINLFNDPEFWQSLWNTVIYTAIVTPMIFIPAIFLAVLINRQFRGIVIFRAIYFLPVTLSFVVASYVWTWIFSDSYGILNYLLQMADIISSPIAWLHSTWSARFAVSLMIAWKTIGLTMLILLAGLQGVPNIVYEAAAIDGASFWQKHRYITAPLMRPTFALALILSVAGSFKAFDQFVVMTGGGPGRSTQTIVMYLEKVGFRRFDLGYAGAISVLFLFLLLILSSLQLRIGRFTE